MSNISRRALYAAGEAFGSSCTRRTAGRIVYGGGDSESSADTSQVDKRNAVQGGIAISGDGSAVHYTATDAGATRQALEANTATTKRALDSVDKGNTLFSQNMQGGYDQLLSAAEKLWERGESLIGQTQQHVADAYQVANTDAKGAIDNKTIVALAVAAGATAAVIAFARRK